MSGTMKWERVQEIMDNATDYSLPVPMPLEALGLNEIEEMELISTLKTALYESLERHVNILDGDDEVCEWARVLVETLDFPNTYAAVNALNRIESQEDGFNVDGDDENVTITVIEGGQTPRFAEIPTEQSARDGGTDGENG